MQTYETIATDDGYLTAAHPVHGETYHSTGGAMLETTGLYVDASGFRNGLDSPVEDPLSVIDVGFGLGYNALATIDCWLTSNSQRSLHLHSLEIDRGLFDAVRSAKAGWSTSWPDSWHSIFNLLGDCGDHCIFDGEIAGKRLRWRLSLCDAADDACLVEQRRSFAPAQYIWQDAFSPKNSPNLWTKLYFGMLLSVAAREQGVLATYSVQRSVRDALTQAGWLPRRIRGAGCKRNWLLATNTSKPLI